MAPKKAAVPTGPPLPTIEEPIELPPELLEKFIEPPFQSCLVHHPESSLTLELAPEGEEERGKLQEIHPNALLVEHYKHEVAEDPLSKSVLIVEREELKAIADAVQAPSLVKGLLLKLERECGARRSRRANAVRKALQEGSEEPHFEEKLDLVFHLVDYPSTPEELNEVLEEKLFEKVDIWLGAFVAGATTIEEESPQSTDPDEPPVPPTRRQERLHPSAQLLEWHRLSQEAPLTSKLSNARVLKLPEVQTLLLGAFQEAAEAEQPKLDFAAKKYVGEIASLVAQEYARSRDFQKWLEQIPVPSKATFAEAAAKIKPLNLTLYRNLADSVPIPNQDIPTLLYCLCEQVAANIDASHADPNEGVEKPGGDKDPDAVGEANPLEEDGAPANVEEVPGQVDVGAETSKDNVEKLAGNPEGSVLLENGEEPQSVEGGLNEGSGVDDQESISPEDADDGTGVEGGPQTGALAGLEDGSLVLPFLDKISCLHAGDELPGGASLVAEVQSILANISMPGISRSGFPTAPYTAAERSAIRNRLYPYLPRFSIVEIERMMLIKGFQDLLKVVQPERLEHDLSDRIFHEKIPKELLVQLLLEAAKEELFLDTKYDERHDCLLLALHARAMPGRSVWHSWAGDLLGDDAPYVPTPSFNDWFQLLSGKAPGPLARAPTTLEAKPKSRSDLDAREFGYGRIVEQSVCGPDGSIVLATTTQRGLQESRPGPKSEEEVPPFPAVPRVERRLARVLREGVAFGLTSDDVWREKTAVLCEARKQREEVRAEAQAALDAVLEERRAAAAEREAQGLPPEEEDENAEPPPPLPEVPAADPEPSSARERLLESVEFGKFWSCFPDGARCSVSIRHDIPWYEEGSTIVDIGTTRPSVTFVYTSASGSSLQVLPDGSSVEHRPKQVCAERVRFEVGSDYSGARAGGPGDVEVSRTVTPTGIFTKELLSGRLEVYHPDGTRSFRNPTWEEFQSRLTKHRHDAEEGCPLSAFMESLAVRYESVVAWRSLKSRPPPPAKAAGLPGHWVVIQKDGNSHGRVVRPRKEEESDAPEEGEGEGAAPTQPKVDEEEKLKELLDGWVVEDEDVIQYEIDPVAITLTTDPHTEQHVTQSSDNVMIIEDGSRACSTALLPDGTRITCRSDPTFQVLIEHSMSSAVACEVKYTSATTTIKCQDGTLLQIVPQSYRDATFVPALAPTCPSHASPECRNTAVVLRRPEGAILVSRGSGSLIFLKSSEAESIGERLFEDLSLIDSSNIGYRINLEENRLLYSDEKGFRVEVSGQSEVSLSVPGMPLTAEAPACIEPMKGYCLQEARALPPPETYRPARLFVIYNNGEAEELLQEQVVRDCLKRAEEDPANSVFRGQAMGSPMDCCKCHSIYRIVSVSSSSDKFSHETAELIPPTLSGTAGFHPDGERKEYTRFRQFIEYPQSSAKDKRLFTSAYEKFIAEEAAHREMYQNYGQGLLRSKMPLRSSPSEVDRNIAPAEGGA